MRVFGSDLSGLLDELAEVYRQLGRVDDALETMRAAIDAGYAGGPTRAAGWRKCCSRWPR
jgi:hypothetical protein